MSPDQKIAWDSAVPKVHLDERVFEETRMRWRGGYHDDLGKICPSVASCEAGGCLVLDGSVVVWPLVRMFLTAGVLLSRTFVNIGAGTCDHPDPLNQLLLSPEGLGFAGLAVEADEVDLRKCSAVMANATARVIPLHLAVHPPTVVASLRPHIQALFKDQGAAIVGRLPLDVLVIDIDGCDCAVVEELLQLVEPKVLVMEIAFHIPPPFRFAQQYDSARSKKWLSNYHVQAFNPAAGCSLSYAVHGFRAYGFHLLRLTHLDAVFVHESVSPVIERGYGLRLPQDEFVCFRRSNLWMQMPAANVREWFFGRHPAESVANIWSNISAVNVELGRPSAPFTLDY